MSKKILSLILTVLTVASLLCFGVNAAEQQITVKVDGMAVSFPDQKPVIVNDRTLVPVRFVAEALGYDVKWNEADNSAVIGGKIVLYIGTDKAKIDGKDVTLDVESKLINDRTMVPLRFVSENLNCTVDWFDANKMILVNKNPAYKSEFSVWERFRQSELFYECTTYESGFYGCLVLKSNYKTFSNSEIYENTKWCIKRSDIIMGYYKDYDCEIVVTGFSEEVRTQLKNMLAIIYPYKYNEAYNIMLDTMRGDIWETFRENAPVPQNNSGTWGTRYLDDREVYIVAEYGLSSMLINISNKGYVNPEKPKTLTAENIAELSKEAKLFYPLDRYGLN